MEQLLTKFSPVQIIICVTLAALAVKGIVTFIEWAWSRIAILFNKKTKFTTKSQTIDSTLAKMSIEQDKVRKSLDKIQDTIELLMNSDKEAIKAFLTHQHHLYCFEKGWIDDFSLDCCERRYAYYKQEEGNTFIDNFMVELRALPNQPQGEDIIEENIEE